MNVYYDGMFHVEIKNQYHFNVENVYDAKRALLKMIAAEFDTEINKKLREKDIVSDGKYVKCLTMKSPDWNEYLIETIEVE